MSAMPQLPMAHGLHLHPIQAVAYEYKSQPMWKAENPGKSSATLCYMEFTQVCRLWDMRGQMWSGMLSCSPATFIFDHCRTIYGGLFIIPICGQASLWYS